MRDEIGGERAAEGVEQRNLLDVLDRRRGVEHARERFRHRHQRRARVHVRVSAVTRGLVKSPDFPPRFSTRRMSAIVMARSTAFSMS